MSELFDLAPSFAPAKPQVPTAESDEWYTPRWLFDPLDKEFAFTVDAAATRESRKVERFYSKAEDGLAQSYAGERVWCNPPYSDIRPWAAKAVQSILDGAECWVSPLPVWTDRKWWHEFVEPFRGVRYGFASPPIEVSLRFVQGRVAFGFPGNPEAVGRSEGGFDATVIVVWRRG